MKLYRKLFCNYAKVFVMDCEICVLFVNKVLSLKNKTRISKVLCVFENDGQTHVHYVF